MTWPVFLTAAVILLGINAAVTWFFGVRPVIKAGMHNATAIIYNTKSIDNLCTLHERHEMRLDLVDLRLDAQAQKLIDQDTRLVVLERTPDPGHRIAEAIRGHRFDRAGELPGFTAGMRAAAFIADDITGNDPIKQQEDQQ